MAIIILTTAVGVLIANDKKLDNKIFEELDNFNDEMLISCKFDRISKNKLLSKYNLLFNFCNNKFKLSNKDYTEFIKNYFEFVGKSDFKSQVDFMSSKKLQIETFKNETKKEYKRYKDMYLKIFFLVGVVIAVLLI